MTNLAALYLRSSKDKSDVSIDAQRRALHDVAQTRNLIVVDEYADAVESGKDDDRPAFQRLLRDLKAPGRKWSTILVLDTARIARRRTLAMIFEQDCAKRKVALVYKSIPDSDPITEMLLKSILQAMDEWHSLTSKAKGLAGMAENVHQGWRAGGRAPKGYKLEYVQTGAVRDGEPVLKSRLVIDDDEAPMVAAYLRLRAQGVTRGQAISQLNLPWPATTLHSLDWQALTYAGHTVWNMAAERVKGGTGEKRRPRSEWIINRGTHEPLVTDGEAEAVLAQMERSSAHKRLRASPLLLSGLLEAPDGRPWHSDGCGYYRLGKGKRILAESIETAILEQVTLDLQSDEAVARILESLQALDDAPIGNRAALEKKIKNATTKIGRTIDLCAKTDNPAPFLRHVSDLEAQRAGWIDELAEIDRARERKSLGSTIDAAQVRAMLRTMFAGLVEADTASVSADLKSVIERVELDPGSLAATVFYAVATGDKMASRSRTDLTPVAPARWASAVIPIQHRRRAA